MNISDEQVPTAAIDGVWKEYGDAKFLIISSKAPAFNSFLARKSRTLNSHKTRQNPELSVELTKDAYAEIVIKDWQGVHTDGEPFVYSKANARKLMELPDFRDWLITESADLANFRAQAITEDVEALKSHAPVAVDVG